MPSIERWYEYYIILYYTRSTAVFSRSEDVAKHRNVVYHLVWTVGNADLMHEVRIPYRIPRACMETVRVKKEEEADTTIIAKELDNWKYGA